MSGAPMLIRPRWSPPGVVQAASTTRLGGHSDGDWASLNLGDSTGDRPGHVAANRERLRRALALPVSPRWLRQVHGTTVVDAAALEDDGAEADAVLAREPGLVCAIRTADCLPVLLADDRGEVVAAAHAGWRGLAAGVIESTVAAMALPPHRLHCWLGPAISASNYEVGEEVRDAFVDGQAAAARCFRPTRPGHWLADLEAVARLRLRTLGVLAIRGGGFCTFRDAARFYSHRRAPGGGRMASLIWINPRT